MTSNPWRVQSIDDFNFLCCPECVYRSKEENSFQSHALQNHELSTTFFHQVDDTEEKSDIDIKVGLFQKQFLFQHLINF